MVYLRCKGGGPKEEMYASKDESKDGGRDVSEDK